MAFLRLDSLDMLPRDLARMIQRELYEPDECDDFIARADAIRDIVHEAELGARRDDPLPETAHLLSPGLCEALREVLDVDPDEMPVSQLYDVLEDLESLWLDPEKLTGHLLLFHHGSPERVLATGPDELVARHRRIHLDELILEDFETS